MSDRFGRRASALLGTGLYVLGSLLGSMTETLTTLYAARVLQSLGAASCAVTAFAWVRDHFDAQESGKWISYLGGMIGTIPTLAPMLGGILAAQWGWQANFVFMALLGSTAFTGAMILMEKNQPAQQIAQDNTGHIGHHILEILTHRQFLTYSLTGMLTMGGILAYATNAPFVAMNLAGLDEFGFALAFGALGILQLLASIIAPQIVVRLGRRKTIMTGTVLALAGAASMLLVAAENPLLFFLPAAIGAIGFNIIFGTASGLTLEHFKHCAGLAAAIDGCIRMAGGGFVAFAIKLAGWDVFATVAMGYSFLLLPLLLTVWDLILLEKNKARGFKTPSSKDSSTNA